jgi:hypothetical protein
MHSSLNRIIAAATALLIVTVVLTFVTINPAILYGVSALLWAVAGIVRAINGAGRNAGPRQLRGSAARQRHLDDGDQDADDDLGQPASDTPVPDEC